MIMIPIGIGANPIAGIKQNVIHKGNRYSFLGLRICFRWWRESMFESILFFSQRYAGTCASSHLSAIALKSSTYQSQ